MSKPDVDNNDRAEWAMKAVSTFQHATGLGKADGLDTAILDLLADLMHLADQHGLDISELWDRAVVHYTAETRGEKG